MESDAVHRDVSGEGNTLNVSASDPISKVVPELFPTVHGHSQARTGTKNPRQFGEGPIAMHVRKGNAHVGVIKDAVSERQLPAHRANQRRAGSATARCSQHPESGSIPTHTSNSGNRKDGSAAPDPQPRSNTDSHSGISLGRLAQDLELEVHSKRLRTASIN